MTLFRSGLQRNFSGTPREWNPSNTRMKVASAMLLCMILIWGQQGASVVPRRTTSETAAFFLKCWPNRSDSGRRDRSSNHENHALVYYRAPPSKHVLQYEWQGAQTRCSTQTQSDFTEICLCWNCIKSNEPEHFSKKGNRKIEIESNKR